MTDALVENGFAVEPLEAACAFDAEAVRDPEIYTERLAEEEIEELLAAVAHARARSEDLLELRREDFPLPRLGPRLKGIEGELMNGRGFVLIRGLPRERLDNDAMCLAYWGVGLHLGRPWPQNAKGHLLGDVTDQGKTAADPTARGNELGGVGLDYHCDGSDLVGLLCLGAPAEGGSSAVASSVALHNRLVRERPDLARELYRPQPFDARGEQAPGAPGWYMTPVFSRVGDRLFVRLIRPYILASQRHADAPRLTPAAVEALSWMQAEAESGRYSAFMTFEPGDMQFVNNYHVLHGRAPYRDDRATGRVRHLKRLWLETASLEERPRYFTNRMSGHWMRAPAISRLDRGLSA